MVEEIRKAEGKVAVITATADFHPLRKIQTIVGRLNHLDFQGLVIFDLLSVNGLEDNRFASMTFSEEGFDLTSFSVDVEVCPAIKREQDLIAKSDQDFLEGSVLSSKEVISFKQNPN